MTDIKNKNKALGKTNSADLVKVGNSLKLTEKILNEYDKRLIETIKIGNQEWMTKSLEVECYSNGDPIPQVKNPMEWKDLKTGAWCCYNNKIENGYKYGKIYNWHALKDERGLCPKGFRLPYEKDWFELLDYLGGQEISGSKLKKLMNLNYGGYINNQQFIGLEQESLFWAITKAGHNADGSESTTWNFAIMKNDDGMYTFDDDEHQGMYVRCIKI